MSATPRKIAILTLVLGLTTMGVSAVQILFPAQAAKAWDTVHNVQLTALPADEDEAARAHHASTIDTDTCVVARCLHKQKRAGAGGLIGMLRAGGSVVADIGPGGERADGAMSPAVPFTTLAAKRFGE